MEYVVQSNDDKYYCGQSKEWINDYDRAARLSILKPRDRILIQYFKNLNYKIILDIKFWN